MSSTPIDDAPRGGISPFSGRLVDPAWAEQVVAPAYDSLSSDARVTWRASNPLSYLNVTRTAEDEPDADTVDNAALVLRGRASLETLLEAQAFAPQPAPRFVAYQIEAPEHSQTGLVAEFDPLAFSQRARPHEEIHLARAALLAEHTRGVGAVSSPIALTIDDNGELARCLARATVGSPDLDLTGSDGVTQRVWELDDSNGEIARSVADGSCYIIDGHHRAAASRTLVEAGLRYPLLVAIFPKQSLAVAGFHRLLRMPQGQPHSGLVDAIARRFKITQLGEFVEPEPNSVCVLIDHAWHHVQFDERPVSGSGLVHRGALDPVVLDREIINPLVLTGGDVGFLPATAGIDELVRVAASQNRIPIVVPAVELDDVITTADAGLTLPAKSTYFTPKVRSGLFLRLFDE